MSWFDETAYATLLLRLCTKFPLYPSNPECLYKNLRKSSWESSSFPSALVLSSTPSRSQPKTPYPYPSIAILVLDMKDRSGVKSSAERRSGKGGSSCSGVVAVWAMLWGYVVVVVELWVFLRKWIRLAVAGPAGSGSGWLVLEMGGYDPLRSKCRTRDATLPVLRVRFSGVACTDTVDSLLPP